MAATAATAATPIDEEVDDITPLLGPRAAASSAPIRKLHHLEGSPAHSASSIISSHVSKDEQTLGALAIGERLPYNDYTTIDWLHDLVPSKFMPTAAANENRSKTLFGTELSRQTEVLEAGLPWRGTVVKVG